MIYSNIVMQVTLWVPYLVAHCEILTILRAPTDSTVQTLVHIAVPFIWPVSTSIFAITQIPLRDAASVGAHEEGAVAQASWTETKMAVTGTTPCGFLTKLGSGIDLTLDLDKLIPFRKSPLLVAPFLFPPIGTHQFPWREMLLVTLTKRFSLRAKQQSYLQQDI